MRNVKVFFFAFFASFLLLSTAAYSSSENVSPKKDLRTSLLELIDHPNHFIYDDSDMTARILFMVNADKELIVIDPGTTNDDLASYIKSRLNYKKVDCCDVKYFKLYCIKVAFE